MKERTLYLTLKKAIQTFPAVVVTGPRQSGKTTLLKYAFGKTHRFVSLENLDLRLRAKDDPLLFLEQYKPPVIIDEIQYVPELLSYIKTKIDEDRKAGQWLLTGSQSFHLMSGITQSLAGRAAVLSLLPFSFAELKDNFSCIEDVDSLIKKSKEEINDNADNKNFDISDVMLRGFYPEIAINKLVDRQLWCDSYISTYLERDVRSISGIDDFHRFDIFLKICATRTGQILNMSDMARDIGVSVPTVKRWLSALESSYQIFLIYPYYRNMGKRFVKSPKLYFNDTAVASYLIGLNSKDSLLSSPSFGSLFETMVVSDFMKRFYHYGKKPPIYYFKTRDGLEVDMVIEEGKGLHLFEIKSAMTLTTKHSYSISRAANDLGSYVRSSSIISLSDESFPLKSDIYNFSWKNILGK